MGVLDSQLSVKILVISQLSVKMLAISQLSVNFNRSHSQISQILANSQLSVKPHQDPRSRNRYFFICLQMKDYVYSKYCIQIKQLYSYTNDQQANIFCLTNLFQELTQTLL